MTIDVWSDVVCPFCYLGARHLQRAIDEFEHAAQIVIRHRAFELDPSARLHYDYPLAELVARKYSMSVEQAETSQRRLEAEAANLGMTWNMKAAQHTNTFDAHRLIAHAAAHHCAAEVSESLFRAYFCEGLLVSDPSVLVAVGAAHGLADVNELLSSDRYASEVRDDESRAMDLGIGGVPAFLIDEKFLVTGAQPPEQLLSVLQRAWARRAA
jgi:protein disulfide-isomerase